MRSLIVLIVLFAFHWAAAAKSVNITSLRFVHALWRHGDRSPASPTFPTDTGNPASSWPQGWGELSREGMRQQFELGRWIRRRYAGFFSDRYSAFEIFVRSTTYNRTLTSAMANFAGFFFPPTEKETFYANISWFPIPVHSVPAESDSLLEMGAICPKADELSAEAAKSNDAQNLMKANKNFLEFLHERTMLNFTAPTNVGKAYDPLNCELQHNDTHQWPSWVNETIFKQIAELYSEASKFYVNSLPWQKLRGGPLLGDLLDRMQKVAAGSLDKRFKYYAYSAHDSTVQALLQNLDAFYPHIIPYCATVFVELHERSAGNFEVEVYYRNDSAAEEPELLPALFKECRNPCPLADFAKFAAAHIPADWAAECRLHDPPEMVYKGVAIGLGVLAFVLAILLAFSLYVNFRTRFDRNRNSYEEV